MSIQFHITAAMHMLDSYNYSKEWTCDCPACEYIKGNQQMIDAFWASIKKQPPNPTAKKSPDVRFLEI